MANRRRNRPKKKKNLRSRLTLFLCLCLIFGLCLYYILSLPVWNIHTIAVTGTNILSADEIRALSGIPLEKNLFFTSLSKARENLKDIPAIKGFRLYRIPPGTILITIKERKPAAVVMLKNKSAIVDDEGYIINHPEKLTLNIANLTEFPVISGINFPAGGKEEKIEPKIAELISDIIFELSSLLGSRQIQIEAGSFERISFLLNDILRVKIGRKENLKQKMSVFKKLLPEIEGKWPQVEYLDVR